MRALRTWFGVAVGGVASLGMVQAASAATLIENFNGYGTTAIALNGLGTADADITQGWSTGWSGSAAPMYQPGIQLTLTKSGYSNVGNDAGGNNGAAGYGTSGNAGSKVKRGVINSPGMQGTVWISALAQVDTGGEALLWFGGDNAKTNFFALRYGGTSFKYNSPATEQTNNTPVAINTPHLMLAKVVVGTGAAPDSIYVWLDPNLSGREAGLGSPLFQGSGAHVFGTVGSIDLDLSAIEVSFNKVTGNAGSYIDAIRVSNDPDAFTKVTMVPEPTLAGVLGLCGIGLLKRRRR